MSGMMLHNGNLVPAGDAFLCADSRALRYGDGFFDTFRAHHGRPFLWNMHMQRIRGTARFLHLRLSPDFSEERMAQMVETLCQANGTEYARMRLQVWRGGGGLYRPEGDDVEWMMQCTPLPSPDFRLNDKGLTVGLFKGCHVPPAPVGSHKTLNALPYVLAAIHARDQGWDEALLTDTGGHIVEASGSNLFLLKGRELLTADLSLGGLPGIMRSQLMAMAGALGYQVSVGRISGREMDWADECLLTNAVHGMRWVLAYGRKRYLHRGADELMREWNRVARLS